MCLIVKWKTDRQRTQPFNYSKRREEKITSESRYSDNPRVEAWPHWRGLVWCVSCPLFFLAWWASTDLAPHEAQRYEIILWSEGPLALLDCCRVPGYTMMNVAQWSSETSMFLVKKGQKNKKILNTFVRSRFSVRSQKHEMITFIIFTWKRVVKKMIRMYWYQL